MTFQARLYRFRKERGISQEDLAEIVGVSRQAVQKWESGASRPDMDNLMALSRYFGITLDYLVTGQESPTAAETTVPARAPYLPGYHYEYRSTATLWGLPLVHINVGRFGIHWARGILAIGNVATGVFALGGISAGVLCLGGTGVGLLTLGGIAVGGIAVGGLAIGALAALGGLAISFGLACGGAAIGGAYAIGGAATATRIAAGGAASASIAIGDAVKGSIAFPQEQWGPGTPDAIRTAIAQMYPNTPEFITALFAFFAK